MAKKKRPTLVDISKDIIREPVNLEEFASIYANDVQITMTPWDFKLRLGVVTEVPTQENLSLRIKPIADIRISPQLAKRLLAVLDGQVKIYEQSIGPIPLSKQL